MGRLLEPSSLSRGTLLKRLPAAWKALPQFGLLKQRVVKKDDLLEVTEVRCVSTALLQLDWEAPEAAIGIVIFAIRVGRRTIVKERVHVMAVVGHHAFARRYERAGRDDISVLKDLIPIVSAWPNVIRQPGDFAVPAGIGTWRGEVMPIVLNGEAISALSVRTYVN
jgi:hypothetical protein